MNKNGSVNTNYISQSPAQYNRPYNMNIIYNNHNNFDNTKDIKSDVNISTLFKDLQNKNNNNNISNCNNYINNECFKINKKYDNNHNHYSINTSEKMSSNFLNKIYKENKKEQVNYKPSYINDTISNKSTINSPFIVTTLFLCE